MVRFPAVDPLAPAFADAVGTSIAGFVAAKGADLRAISPRLEPVARMAADFTSGGKRIRPAFCYWGYRSVTDDDPPPGLIDAAASLDLLHDSALVHDDVMDASDTRRGLPSAHRQFEALHTGMRGDAAGFGRAGAILLGDLLLMWSVEMASRAHLPPAALDRALPVLEAMRHEVTAGQFLDVYAQGRELVDSLDLLDEVTRVVDYKTTKYTVERPLQFGAALAGAPEATMRTLHAYAAAVGRAFQYRDDLLGAFGDAEVTGKPSGDDLREGKLTALVAYAFQAGGPAVSRLKTLLGRPGLAQDDIDEARDLLRRTGAVDRVEADIAENLAAALDVVDSAALTEDGTVALRRLAHLAATRSL